MDPRLQLAIDNDDVVELYRLNEGNLLNGAFEDPSTNSPLHNAADKGKTQVAMEMAILKPSFTRKLNRGGYSPMHLALQKKHYRTVRALMTLDPELIRVQGRGGITPLHFIAGERGGNEEENMELPELLAEFLSACKSSIEDLTSQRETAVHVAVKRGNTEAFKVLFGWLKRVRLTQILNWKDQDGNTVLHIAAYNTVLYIAANERQPEIIKLLIGYSTVKAKNFRGMTALQIFRLNHGDQDLARKLHDQEWADDFFINAASPLEFLSRQCDLGYRAAWLAPTLSLSQFFSRELTPFEMCSDFFGVVDDTARNIILVVCTLIAAATYQAALTPPRGYWQDSFRNPAANSTVVAVNSSRVALGESHQAGDTILSGWSLFGYTFFNSMAFLASISTIWATTFTVEVNPLLYTPIPILCAAYFFSFLLQIPLSPTNSWAVVSLDLLFCLFSTAVFGMPLFLRMTYTGDRQRIDATRSGVAAVENRRIQGALLVLFCFTILALLASVACPHF